MSDARKRAEEALARWDGCRVCQTWKPVRAHAGSLAAALRALLAEPARETTASPATPLDHVAFLTGLPVELNSLLPEGSIFMHLRTKAKKVTCALDGDGRDGFNGSGPFEG